jgi:hypothetical protein
VGRAGGAAGSLAGDWTLDMSGGSRTPTATREVSGILRWQYRQITAASWICSAQYGQDFTGAPGFWGP